MDSDRTEAKLRGVFDFKIDRVLLVLVLSSSQ